MGFNSQPGKTIFFLQLKALYLIDGFFFQPWNHSFNRAVNF